FHFDSVSMPGLLADPGSRCSTTPDAGNSLVRLEFSVVCVIFPLKAAFMASPAQPAANAGIQDLASRIYVELVGRAFLRADNTEGKLVSCTVKAPGRQPEEEYRIAATEQKMDPHHFVISRKTNVRLRVAG